MVPGPEAEKPRVLVLVGPTASGKTAVSLRLARLLRGEIISADSRQIYTYLDIGTAKPSPAERKYVPHHFIDILPPDADYSAGDFGTQARDVIRSIRERERQAIVVGGSGLYVRSLIDGFFEGPGAHRGIRAVLEERIREGRVSELIEELRRVDPDAGSRADPTKPRRIVRALEVYYLTGKPLSVHQKEGGVTIDFRAVQFGLEWEREVLYRRIEVRCREMIARGLLAEIEGLERLGYGPELNALKTVGYAEGFAYRRGEISGEEMMRLFQQNSRRYAKRQRTWFRADRRIRWISMDETRDVADVAAEIANSFREMGAEHGSCTDGRKC